MKRAELLRFVGYAFIGAAGTLAQYAVLAVLVYVKLSGAVVASCLGAVLGAVINYLLNYRFTFKVSGMHRHAAPRFAIVAAAAIALNGAMMTGLTHHLNCAWLPAQIATTFAVLLFSYTASACWTFRTRQI